LNAHADFQVNKKKYEQHPVSHLNRTSHGHK